MPVRSNPAARAATLEPVPQLTVLPAPVPAKTGIKKVSFAKVPKKSEDTKTKYPVFHDEQVGAQVLDIAERIKNRATDIKALEGAQATDKAELKMFVSPFYFRVNHGNAAPPSSVSIPTKAGEVLVSYTNRYPKLESEAPLIPIIGQQQTEHYFRQSFSLEIDGAALPAGQEQAIVDAVTEVLQKFGALEALEVKEAIKPTPDFHVARHTLFTPEVNLALDQVFPIVAMVKTEGRDK